MSKDQDVYSARNLKGKDRNTWTNSMCKKYLKDKT